MTMTTRRHFLASSSLLAVSCAAAIVRQAGSAAGLQAAVPAGLTLPVFYDTAAQMPALRRRDLYLPSNAGVQLGMLRLDLIGREYPNG
nr:hypothetical protein [Burkholderia anthina]